MRKVENDLYEVYRLYTHSHSMLRVLFEKLKDTEHAGIVDELRLLNDEAWSGNYIDRTIGRVRRMSDDLDVMDRAIVEAYIERLSAFINTINDMRCSEVD